MRFLFKIGGLRAIADINRDFVSSAMGCRRDAHGGEEA